MAIHDATYVNRYKGILGWNGGTQLETGVYFPPIEVELFIKEHPIPIRKPKPTEVVTMPQVTPVDRSHDTSTAAIFFGAPDLLQLQLSGWIITPKINNQWRVTDTAGNPLNWGNITYAEVIGYLLSGQANMTRGQAMIRRDPDYYISPYGLQYAKPIVAQWEPQYSPNMRKQPFSMTLYLES